MKKKSIAYNLINALVIIVTIALFYETYRAGFFALFGSETVISIPIIVVTVILVHAFKAARLYLTLYGNGLNRGDFLRTYCKVTPVSVVIPFKLGEFFRMYCYGKEIGSFLKGVVLVLLDRFMDTIALIAAIVFVSIFTGGSMSLITVFLLIFAVFVFVIYLSFPGIYKTWKKYLLREKATPGKLSALKALQNCNLIYEEISGVVKGRGMILFLLSLIAWAIEIGSIALLAGLRGQSGLSNLISDYLLAAMGKNTSDDLKRFVFVSVAVTIVIYVALKAIKVLKGDKGKR
jgi:hypothetical protein